MSNLPMKKLSTRERAQLRVDATMQARELVTRLASEYGTQTLNLQPNTLEHETARQLSETFSEAIEELDTRHMYAALCLFYYDKGGEDERSHINEEA